MGVTDEQDDSLTWHVRESVNVNGIGCGTQRKPSAGDPVTPWQ